MPESNCFLCSHELDLYVASGGWAQTVCASVRMTPAARVPTTWARVGGLSQEALDGVVASRNCRMHNQVQLFN